MIALLAALFALSTATAAEPGFEAALTVGFRFGVMRSDSDWGPESTEGGFVTRCCRHVGTGQVGPAISPVVGVELSWGGEHRFVAGVEIAPTYFTFAPGDGPAHRPASIQLGYDRVLLRGQRVGGRVAMYPLHFDHYPQLGLLAAYRAPIAEKQALAGRFGFNSLGMPELHGFYAPHTRRD